MRIVPVRTAILVWGVDVLAFGVTSCEPGAAGGFADIHTWPRQPVSRLVLDVLFIQSLVESKERVRRMSMGRAKVEVASWGVLASLGGHLRRTRQWFLAPTSFFYISITMTSQQQDLFVELAVPLQHIV